MILNSEIRGHGRHPVQLRIRCISRPDRARRVDRLALPPPLCASLSVRRGGGGRGREGISSPPRPRSARVEKPYTRAQTDGTAGGRKGRWQGGPGPLAHSSPSESCRSTVLGIQRTERPSPGWLGPGRLGPGPDLLALPCSDSARPPLALYSLAHPCTKEPQQRQKKEELTRGVSPMAQSYHSV